jgi:outer membrane lipoprotein-sorting protein
MKTLSRRLFLAALLLGWVQGASAQTADEVIEKHLTAIGGRAALAKLKSRTITGTMTISTPGGDVSGPIEIVTQAPNKSRTLLKMDLTAVGGGPIVIDQRFDGNTGYVLDTLQGDRDISGNQLDNMRNAEFPNPLLNYKAMGMTAKLGGKEKAGARDAYVLILEPTSGSVVRQYLDAATYLPIQVVMTINMLQFGDVEQTTEFSDFRDVDGVKIPFLTKATSSVQTMSIAITKVEHNMKIDEALFAKPAAK